MAVTKLWKVSVRLGQVLDYTCLLYTSNPMEEICSIKLFESDLESMLSQVIAKARSRDEKLKAAKEKAAKDVYKRQGVSRQRSYRLEQSS